MPDSCLLVADIGGTNARFALADPGHPAFRDSVTLNCKDYADAHTAISRYLESVGADNPDVICVAAAGPIVNNAVQFTNNQWSLDIADLEARFRARDVQLLNDFEAIAYSIPLLGANECLPIGLAEFCGFGEKDFNIAVIGPGTGLGAVGLKRYRGALIPIIGEAGHIEFASESDLQSEIVSILRKRYGRVSVERLLSGPGIENIYWALEMLDRETSTTITAAEIFAKGLSREDPRAIQSVQCFFELLGQFARHTALTLGAWDGVFVAGGISGRYPDALISSQFRSSFENLSTHRELLEAIPTQLVTMQEPGLLGASYCALESYKELFTG